MGRADSSDQKEPPNLIPNPGDAEDRDARRLLAWRPGPGDGRLVGGGGKKPDGSPGKDVASFFLLPLSCIRDAIRKALLFFGWPGVRVVGESVSGLL